MTSSGTPRRYSRQELLPGVGADGQRRIAETRVLLVGCGALGCTVADLLARAGVGTIAIIDRDVVELSNLQRQSLFDERDARDGLPKAEGAARRLAEINSTIEVEGIVADLTCSNADALLDRAAPAIIVDGTDSFETRFLLNDLAVSRSLPLVYGGAVASRGSQMTIVPGRTACLRCVIEEPPVPGTTPTCDREGILGPAAAVTGAAQAAEVLRLAAGITPLSDRGLVGIDLWADRIVRIGAASAPRPDCPCCGMRRFEFLRRETSAEPVVICGQDAVHLSPGSVVRPGVDLHALASRLGACATVASGKSFVRATLTDERAESGEPVVVTIFGDGRAIVRGTRTPERARAIYARYIGS